MSDIITLPRVVALYFREALICGKGRSPHRCHDCDFHLDEAALDALDAALAEPDATREPATHEQAVAAYDGKKGTHRWVDFRDGWQAAYASGAAAQREKDAQVCESITWSDEGKFFAKAIRERSE